MKIYHIVAMDRNRVIGKDNRLPWRFSEDLRYFKRVTMGSTVLMGRKTFESIGKPLSGRENFVLTRTLRRPDEAHLRFFDSLNKALSGVKTAKCFIIGGASLYKETIQRADGLFVTHIGLAYDGDAHYPPIPSYFSETSRTVLLEEPRLEAVIYEKL